MCGGKGLFQVEDLPVGPRWFCTEKHFAQYAGLPVKESGYYGFDPIEYEHSGDEPEYNWENDNFEAESFEATEWIGFCPECNKWRTKEMSKIFKNNRKDKDDEEYITDLAFNGWTIPKKLLGKQLCMRGQRFGNVRSQTDSFTGYGQRTHNDSYCGTPLTKVKSKYKSESFEAEEYKAVNEPTNDAGLITSDDKIMGNFHFRKMVNGHPLKPKQASFIIPIEAFLKNNKEYITLNQIPKNAHWRSDSTKNAESKKLPPVEKAIDTGIASGATMEGLDLALGAEGILCKGCPEAGRHVVIRKDHTDEDGNLICPFCHSNKNFKNIPETTYLLHGGRKDDLMAAESHKNHIGELPMPKLPLSQKEINRWAKEIEWGRRSKGIIYQNVKWPSPTKFFREAFKKPIVGKDKKGKEIAQWQNKLHPFYPVYYIVANQEERWKNQKESQRKTLERNKLIKQIKGVLYPPHHHSYWSHNEDGILGQAWFNHSLLWKGKPIGVEIDGGKVGRRFPRPLKTQQKDAFYEYLKNEMKSGTDAYGNQYGIEHYKPIMGVIIDAYNDYRLHFDYDYLFGDEIGPNTPPQDERPAFLYIDSPEKGLRAAKKEWRKYKDPHFGDVSAKPKPKPKIPNPAFAKWVKDYGNYEAHYDNLEKLSKKLNGLYEEQTLINITTTSSKIKDGKIDLTRTMKEGLDGGDKGNIDSDIDDILAEFPNAVRYFNIQYNGYDISMKSANSMREEISSRRPPKYLMEKSAESFASWNEHTCEHCDSTDIDYGNNWKCHDCGRYAAEEDEDDGYWDEGEAPWRESANKIVSGKDLFNLTPLEDKVLTKFKGLLYNWGSEPGYSDVLEPELRKKCNITKAKMSEVLSSLVDKDLLALHDHEWEVENKRSRWGGYKLVTQVLVYPLANMYVYFNEYEGLEDHWSETPSIFDAEYNRDSKGRFRAKPVITLTTAAIVGFVGAYLWGRRN